MNDKPKSRKPSSWPTKITSVLESAIHAEILIPIENSDKIRAFRKTVNEIRRSYREHNHHYAEGINSLAIVEYVTSEIMEARPRYRPSNPEDFPITLCISPALGFLNNITEAHTSHTPISPHELSPVDPNTYEIDQELLDLVKDYGHDDSSSAADIFRKAK